MCLVAAGGGDAEEVYLGQGGAELVGAVEGGAEQVVVGEFDEQVATGEEGGGAALRESLCSGAGSGGWWLGWDVDEVPAWAGEVEGPVVTVGGD